MCHPWLNLFSLFRSITQGCCFGSDSSFHQQLVQLRKLLFGHVTEVLFVDFQQRLANGFHQSTSLSSDGNHHDPTVTLAAIALDKLGFGQAIDQASNIGNTGHHLLNDFQARQAFAVMRVQNLQDVVLRAG